MNRHLDNMRRLYAKLQARYGGDDDLVLKLKHELRSLEAIDSKKRATAHYRRRKHDRREVSIPLQ